MIDVKAGTAEKKGDNGLTVNVSGLIEYLYEKQN